MMADFPTPFFTPPPGPPPGGDDGGGDDDGYLAGLIKRLGLQVNMLTQQVVELGRRVSALEARAGVAPKASKASRPPGPPAPPGEMAQRSGAWRP